MSTPTEDGRAGQEGARPPEGAGEGGPRWPRRRLLRWALGLVPVAAGGGWAAFEWLGGREAGTAGGVWSDPQLNVAGWSCMAGERSAASKVEALLESPGLQGPARLLGACLSMEAGEWDRVRKHLAFPGVRDTPEARLLLELAERRPRAPDWRHAFLETWKALGKPDFRKSTLLPPPLESHLLLADPRDSWEAADESRRLPLVALYPPSMAQPRTKWVLEQVRASTSVPLLLALYESFYAQGEDAPLLPPLIPKVVERLRQLAGPSPRTLQLALLFFLAGGPPPKAPFERRDLEALEKLVSLREWKQPASEPFFREMRASFEGLMPAPGHHAWLVTCLAQGVMFGHWLLGRAWASKAHLSEDDLRWLGRLLWEVGARLREQPSDRELDMGLRLQVRGSELTGHSPSRVECLGMWVELGRWEDAVKQAAYDRWPLASLQEEACEARARNEHVWMKAFAGKNELP